MDPAPNHSTQTEVYINMARTITVKGIGKASAKPDQVVLHITLESRDMNYQAAVGNSADQLEKLGKSLTGIGFEKDSVKTTYFNVRTDYTQVRDEKGMFQNVFSGYVVSHALKLAFDFDPGRLSETLGTVAGSLADPQLSIEFTVKDPAAINGEMLRSATVNAKSKAETLCAASGVKMGELLSIDYSWGDRALRSNTRFDMAEESMPMMAMGKSIDIAPEDIEVTDTATFVWEIL
jgi:hypothetical protein